MTVHDPTPDRPLAYRFRDAAHKVGCSENHLRNLARDGKLRTVRIGNAVRIVAADLHALVDPDHEGGAA